MWKRPNARPGAAGYPPPEVIPAEEVEEARRRYAEAVRAHRQAPGDPRRRFEVVRAGARAAWWQRWQEAPAGPLPDVAQLTGSPLLALLQARG